MSSESNGRTSHIPESPKADTGAERGRAFSGDEKGKAEGDGTAAQEGRAEFETQHTTPGAESEDQRQPLRDVVRDPDAPSLASAVGTWPSPEAGETGAINFGHALYALLLSLALTLIKAKERAVTRLRLGTVAAERAQALKTDKQTVAGAQVQQQIEIAKGAAAESERERLARDDIPRREADLKRAESKEGEARARAEKGDAAVATGDVFEQDDHFIRKVAWLLPVEIVISALLIMDAISARIPTPIPVIGPFLIALGIGAAMTVTSLVMGVVLGYVAPRKIGAAVLLIVAAAIFVRLVGHLADLRLEKDDGPLALGDIQLLVLDAAAFTGWALAANLGFTEIRRARARAHEHLVRVLADIDGARKALEQVHQDIAATARYAAETPARALAAELAARHAEASISTTTSVYDGIVESEEAHGELREQLGTAAVHKARSEQLRTLGEIAATTGHGGAPEWRAIRPAVWVAMAALLLGGGLGLVLGSFVAPAVGAVVAALALVLGLRPPAPALVDTGREPEGTVRPLTQPRRPWVRMPKHQTGGRGSADAASNHI